MPVFRRLLTATFLLTLMAATATAQVVTPGGGGGGGTLSCSANVANPTQVRPESYSELLGEVVILCVGGALSDTVPVANITVAINNAAVTSRVFPNGLSEALLLIDETGAGPSVGPGGMLPQTLCAGGALGAGPGGCETQPGTVGAYTGAVLKSNPSVVPNVFQGVVTDNQVVFNNIPILAPVTAGLARVFRITNVRVNANQFAGQYTPNHGQVPVVASISISNGTLTLNPVQVGGFVFDALSSQTSVRNSTNTAAGSNIALSSCSQPNLVRPGAVLRFVEGFAAAFRTRIFPTSTLSGAATPPGSITTATSFSQNLPAQVLPESESGFTLPVTGGTAGLADFGTRLRATFRNVPPGVSLYVSTTNVNALGVGNPGALANGDFANAHAGLVTTETATAVPGSALPLRAGTINANGVNLYGPLPVDGNGTAIAVWEVFNTASSPEFLDFAVHYAYNGGALPATPIGTVTLSLGPLVTGDPIPRFVQTSAPINLISVEPCYLTSLTSSANPSSYGQPVTFTATLSGSAPLPPTIAFTEGATTLATAPLVNGTATMTTNTLSVGPHYIWGIFTGGIIFQHTQTVAKASTTTSLAPGGPVTAGSTTTLIATVAPAFSGTPTGTITFREGASVLSSATLDASGVARFLAPLGIGVHAITATYNGDANFLTSTASRSFSVDPVPTSVSTPILVSGTPAPGQPLTFSATVSADGQPVSGTLTFRDGSTVLGTAEVNSSGTGTITTSALGAGIHLITASYSGVNSPATSAALFLTLKATPTVTLTSSLNPSTPGSTLTITAAVASPAGAPAPTGSVSFLDGSTALGTVNLNSSAQAVLTLASGLAAGDHSIVGTYNGDPNLAAASSAPLVQRVTRIPTTTTLGEGITRAGFVLTSLVSAERGVPTGALEFRDVSTGAVLGTANLSGGLATLVVPFPLPTGHTIEAAYPGDTAYAPSSSTRQTFLAAVNGFSMFPGFAPDGIATIFGAGFSTETAAAPGIPLPTTLAGVEVRVVDSAGGQHPAMLYYVSPGQINFVIPPDAPLGPAQIVVVQGQLGTSVSVAIARTAPGLASADGTGAGDAAAQVIRVHPDGSQDPPVTVTAIPIASAPGDRLFLVLYGTGLRHAGAGLSCSLNGQPVPVLYSGAHTVYTGLDQVNLEIPAGLRGTLSITCAAGDQLSNPVTVNLQ